jgi:hypothetical protein
VVEEEYFRAKVTSKRWNTNVGLVWEVEQRSITVRWHVERVMVEHDTCCGTTLHVLEAQLSLSLSSFQVAQLVSCISFSNSVMTPTQMTQMM